MPAPTWTTGEVLASADVNEWFVPIAAVKTATQSVTNSTVFVNDNELFINIEANNYYAAEMYVEYEGGVMGSSDIQWAFSLPGTTTFHYMVHCINTSNQVASRGIVYGTTVENAGTSGSTRYGLMIMGTIWGATASGQITFRWAQNTANATATIVHPGSWFKARRIA